MNAFSDFIRHTPYTILHIYCTDICPVLSTTPLTSSPRGDLKTMRAESCPFVHLYSPVIAELPLMPIHASGSGLLNTISSRDT